MSFQMFKWVPDGTYDYEEFMVRYEIVNCNPKTVKSKMWVDSDHARGIGSSWGTYPDFPPKPPKK